MIDAVGYFLNAWKMARAPGMRRWVILPLLFNIALFALLYWLIGSWVSGWIAAFGANVEPSGGLAFMNGVIAAGIWILQALAWLTLLMFFASTFTITVQLVAAPFMGLLAEQVDRRISATLLPEETLIATIRRTFRRELRKTWDWLWRTLLVAILVVVLMVIPGVNLLAPFVWFLWSGWLLGLQYVDYGADTRQVPFLSMKAAARRSWWLVLSFGCLVLALTMVPLVNLTIMPIAVIAGVMIWHRRLVHHVRTDLPGQPR